MSDQKVKLQEVESSSQMGGHLLVECLIAQGVTHAFGVPGESYLAALDGFHKYQDQIQFVTCRQEGGAAFMAVADGRLRLDESVPIPAWQRAGDPRRTREPERRASRRGDRRLDGPGLAGWHCGRGDWLCGADRAR